MVPQPGESSPAVMPVDGRKLIAVVFADMAGYSRLLGLDDADTVARLRELRNDLIDPAITRHGGNLVSTSGDNLMVTFDSIIAAVRFAVDVQRGIPEFDGDYPADRRVRFRVGINVGDVIPHGTNLHGEGVNIAARLQAICPPGAICVSRVVRDHVGNRLGLSFKELGAIDLKNIARPTEAFLLELEPSAETTPARALSVGTSQAAASSAGAALLFLQTKQRRRSAAAVAFALVCVAVVIGVIAMTRLHLRSNGSSSEFAKQTADSDFPALSIVVLPFVNLSGDPEQTYLADGISEDLTTDLSHLDNAFVIARESAFTYRGKSVDVRDVGRALGVRYVLEGSVRKLADVVRINAQLVSASDGAHVWAERFDQPLRDLQAGQDSTVQRIGYALNVKFDSTKQQKATASNPTAYDLVLRAKAILREPQNESRDAIAAGFFEQALRVDPTSVAAMAGIAAMLVKTSRSTRRAADLIAKAELVAPDLPDVLAAKFRLLRRQQRYTAATETFRKLLDVDSSAAGLVAEFDACSLCWGRPEDAVDLIARTARLNPLSPDRGVIDYTLGRMLLVLGRDTEAIDWLKRARRAMADRSPSQLRASEDTFSESIKIILAAAYALTGDLDNAHAMVASAMSSQRMADFTVRSVLRGIPGYYDTHGKQQEMRIAEGLRLAGLRDHLDERTDFRVQSTSDLQENYNGPTPVDVPGATTVTTGEMARLLEKYPLVIATAVPNPSIPGSIRFELPTSGTLTDEWQVALGTLMDRVAQGDKQRAVVTFSYSINHWQSRNLALRLVALGYRNVYWYRGGWEAWDAHDLPKTPVDLQFAPQR